MAIHYETKATNVGGRKGHVYTDDETSESGSGSACSSRW